MLPFEPTVLNIIVVVVAVFAAGTSKGVLGVGIPLIIVPALGGIMHPATTIALLALPILLSNVWQSFEGRRFRATFRRFWPAILTIVIGSTIGAQFITTVDRQVAQIVLGVIVSGYALSQLLKFSVPKPPERVEKFWTGFAGFISGILGGMAAYFGPPIIIYMLALRVTKEEFIGAVAMLYMIGAMPLFAILIYKGTLGGAEFLMSVVVTTVIFAAMLFGRWLRDKISHEVFRKSLLVILLVMGANMLRQGLA